MTINPVFPPPPYLRVVEFPDVTEQAESVAGIVETFARLADELASMVEAEAQRSAQAHAVIAAALGELHTELDELATRVTRGEL